MDTTRKEYEAHQNQVLGAFLAEAGNRVEALEQDAMEAQEAFRKCVVYFGETSKTMPPDTFFPMFDRFIKAYDKAENDLKKWEMIQKKKIEKLEAVRIFIVSSCLPFILLGENCRDGAAKGWRTASGETAVGERHD